MWESAYKVQKLQADLTFSGSWKMLLSNSSRKNLRAVWLSRSLMWKSKGPEPRISQMRLPTRRAGTKITSQYHLVSEKRKKKFHRIPDVVIETPQHPAVALELASTLGRGLLESHFNKALEYKDYLVLMKCGSCTWRARTGLGWEASWRSSGGTRLARSGDEQSSRSQMLVANNKRYLTGPVRLV